jgi:hypothetical protein
MPGCPELACKGSCLLDDVTGSGVCQGPLSHNSAFVGLGVARPLSRGCVGSGTEIFPMTLKSWEIPISVDSSENDGRLIHCIVMY